MTDLSSVKTMAELFFEEYTSQNAIQKYTRASAGHGISYLLDHDYKDVYLQALQQLPAEAKQRGLRMLEFGCGGGMNLVHLVSVLTSNGVKIETALGADFSPVLIDAAQRDSMRYLSAENQGKVQFHVAKNENLVAGLADATDTNPAQLTETFDFILGVNTIRYCHHGQCEMDCVRGLKDLLRPGSVCVNIDMSNRFPLFRSAVKNKLTGNKVEECYIPSLEEYAAPFEKTGFEILRKEHFCWVSHSAGPVLCLALRALTPVLNLACKSRAMRSLVVARKPVAVN